jgi:hypothetical protein
MIISDSHKFIFSHLYKAGGTSMRSSLSPYGKENGWKNIPLGKHDTLNQIKKAIPKEIFDSYYKFTFVRNTWSWQVSLYEYMLRDIYHPQRPIMLKLGNFDNYVHWRIDGNIDLQKEYAYDENNNLLADYVGRLETIESDMNHLGNKLNIQYTLPHLNKQNYKPYKEYYTDTTRKLFEDAYAEDIKLFNFTF